MVKTRALNLPLVGDLIMTLRLATFALTTLLCALASTAWADPGLTVTLNKVDENGAGPSVGQVIITQTPYGVLLTPALTGLPPGLHGFHVHENPSCASKEKDGKKVPALAAGGHFDPKKTGQHGAPWGEGHLGDLPALYVDPQGQANQPVLAPRLTLADLAGRSLMIHAGGDNHADHPAPLGGGGARVVCGVMP